MTRFKALDKYLIAFHSMLGDEELCGSYVLEIVPLIHIKRG